MTFSRRQYALSALQIAIAYAQAGTHEEGGNNRGGQVEFFQSLMGGAPGDPWCADFVCSCLVKAYARLNGLDESRAGLAKVVRAASGGLIPLCGYCPGLATAAGGNGLLKPAEFAAAPGDLVLFDFHGQGEPHHVGFVRSMGNLTIQTVEGNTSSGQAGSQADGDGVFLRTRSRFGIFGFVHW